MTLLANLWQTRRKPLLAAAAIVAVIVGIVVLRAILSPADKRQRSAVLTVRIAVSEQKNMPVMVRANGYVTAIQIVDVRPQIQNVVRAIHVREGQDVAAGQLLFTLDARSDAANVDKAQAQLARDRADLIDAEATLRRNQELFAKKFISQAVVDTAKAKVDALRGTARADRATVDSSNVALGYNRITASIAGRIGAIGVHPGSLVQPSGVAMVTIAQIDPIHVSFTVPEAELAHITASLAKGRVPVTIQLADGQASEGELMFIDNATDQQSGTIKMKAQFDNKERKLWPGSFVSVKLVSRMLPQATVVPTPAVITGPKEQIVYVVQNDDTVQAQAVKLLATNGGMAAVSGLDPGARVVIEGAQNLRPGMKVREAPAAEQKKSDS